MVHSQELVDRQQGESSSVMMGRWLNGLSMNEKESVEEGSMEEMGVGEENAETTNTMGNQLNVTKRAGPSNVDVSNIAPPTTPRSCIQGSPIPEDEYAYDQDRSADEIGVENGLLEEDETTFGESLDSTSLGRSKSLMLVPRSNRAALLRQGIAVTDQVIRNVVPVNFAHTPGHKREGLQVVVPSLTKPDIVPRPNRATLIRNGQITPSARKATPRFPSAPSTPLSVSRAQTEIFANTPGHKRAGSVVTPKSCDKPRMSVRETRASVLRAGGDVPPSPGRLESELKAVKEKDSAYGGSIRSGLAVKKRAVALPASLGTPTMAPRSNRASMLRNPSTPTCEGTKPSSRRSLAMSPEQITNLNNFIFEGVPGHKRRESLQVASTAGPVMTPRLNRASMLRQDPSNAQPSPSAVHSNVVFRARPLPAFYGRAETGDGASRRMSKPPVGCDDDETF